MISLHPLGTAVASLALAAGCTTHETVELRLGLDATPQDAVTSQGAGGLYFGLEVPKGEPEVFAPGIISREGRYEQFLLITPDEKELVLGITNRMWSSFDFQFMRQRDGRWGDPVRAPFLGREGDGDGIVAAFAHDGRRVFFTSSRPSYPAVSIWSCARDGMKWGEPVRMAAPVYSSSIEFEVAIAADGTLYFSSDRPGGHGDLDLYRAPLVGDAYPAVENLGKAINTEYGDDLPWIAPDESYLLFGSTRPDGYGERDLYISRRVNGAWTEAVNLGPTINTAGFDIYPTVSPDGKVLFFTRRESWTTTNDSDIYWVSTKVLELAK